MYKPPPPVRHCLGFVFVFTIGIPCVLQCKYRPWDALSPCLKVSQRTPTNRGLKSPKIVTACGLIRNYRRFEKPQCLHLQSQVVHDPKQEGAKIFRNVANYLPINATQHRCENLKCHAHKHFYKPRKLTALGPQWAVRVCEEILQILLFHRYKT